jgi:hypothetical protein
MADVRGLIGSRFPSVPAAGETLLASALSVVLIGGPGVAKRRHGAELSEALGGIGKPLLEPCRGKEAAEESTRDDRGRS